ncbi:MAG: hypothetical protein WB777_06000, partial [Mycobacterium sp.]
TNVGKIAVAGALLAVPAAVTVPAYAAPGVGGVSNTPAVLLAPPPADPPQPPPPPPPSAQTSNGEYYNPNDPNDWWPYAGTGSF